MDRGVGVWLAPQVLGAAPADEVRRVAARIEELGYRSIWTGEPPVAAPDVFTQLGSLLAATRRITVGAGIANITLREPPDMASAAARLAGAYPGRLVLGLGGHSSVAQISVYLDAMPGDGPPRVLAALGPRMLELAAKRADGAHPFHMPVAHTARARTLLGPGPLLLPEQAFTLDTDAEHARAGFRALYSGVRPDSPYTRNLRRLGYTDADLAGPRSDRLVDDLLAHGTPDAVAARLRAHHDAGADQVLAAPLATDLPTALDQLTHLAPAVTRRAPG